MYLWFGQENSSFPRQASSLNDIARRLQLLNKRGWVKTPCTIYVYKSYKAWEDGLDFKNYDWDGERLSKSKTQPAAFANRLFFGKLEGGV